MSQDRAAVAAVAIASIVTEALRAWLRGAPSSLLTVRKEIENYLRDEITAAVRDARADFKLSEE